MISREEQLDFQADYVFASRFQNFKPKLSNFGLQSWTEFGFPILSFSSETAYRAAAQAEGADVPSLEGWDAGAPEDVGWAENNL